MVQVLTHIKVQDYPKWRPVFDELKGLREAHGLISERVFRSAANPNEVFIEMDYRESEAARAYMTSTQLREGMQRAGVIPPPEINYLEEAPTVAALDNSTRVVNQVTAAIEAQNWDKALSLLADGFVFSGATPNPISGAEWIGVHRALGAAMPDLRMNYIPSVSNGTHTEGTVKLTGTHTGEFSAPMPGLPRVAATGKAIANPTEHVWVAVKDGKLTEWRVEQVPSGGLLGILKQMGVALPHG